MSARIGLCLSTHRVDPDRARSARPGSYLCDACHDGLDRLLAQVPQLADDLERAMIPGAEKGAKISGTPERALPFNERVGQARRELLDWLRSWTGLIAEERGHALPHDLSPRGQVNWHRVQLQMWTGSQPWVDEYATNLRAYVGAGRGALRGQRWKRVPVGACPDADRCDVSTRIHITCRGTLTGVVDLADELLPATVECTNCGREYTARDLPSLGQRLTGGHAWLTTAQVAQVLGLSESRVRHMASDMGWRRRDAERVRPSRWHADDVDETRRRVSA